MDFLFCFLWPARANLLIIKPLARTLKEIPANWHRCHASCLTSGPLTTLALSGRRLGGNVNLARDSNRLQLRPNGAPARKLSLRMFV